MDALALRTHFATNHGVVSHGEALAFGLSRGQIARRIASGEWSRVAPGAYRLSGAPTTWRGLARAHALSCRGLVSHRAAAALWGIDGFDESHLEITIPRGRRLRRAEPIIHESKQMDLARATVIDSIPVTGLDRTVLDLGAVFGPRRLEWAVDAVVRQRLLEWPDLLSVLVNHSARGRDGCGRLRTVLEERYGTESIPDSRWNRMVGDLLVSAGLPQPEFEYVVEDPATGRFVGRVDLAYPNSRIAIECDSVRWHLNRTSFERDPRRRNALLLSGWSVLTFTWSDYADRPWALCQTVRDALAERSGGACAR